MSLQNPPGALTPGIYLSRSWGSAPDPEVCLLGCRERGAGGYPAHALTLRALELCTCQRLPCTRSRLGLLPSAQLKRKAATTNWELRPSQPVVAAYHVMLSRSYRESIIKSQHLWLHFRVPNSLANPVCPPLTPSQAPPPPRARP